MTPAEFAARLAGLELSQTEAAQVFGVRRESVNRWANGSRVVPTHIVAHLATLTQLQEATR